MVRLNQSINNLDTRLKVQEGIVHGDIKPANVLIFEDYPRRYVAKVADFGYSTWLAGFDDLIYMPYSPHWTAPEWHRRGFDRASAFKMDVYSFGLLYIWLILYCGRTSKYNQFYEDLRAGEGTSALTKEDVEDLGKLNKEQRQNLKQLFDLTLAFNPEVRCSNFEDIRDLLPLNL